MPIALVHLNDEVRERRLMVRDGAALEIHTGTVDDGAVVVFARQGTCLLDNRSRLKCLVNGVEVQQVAIHPGDRIEIGAEVYEVERSPDHLDASCDDTRSSRRVSASRIPAVNSDGRRGFLHRVGRLLAARSQRAGRLKNLEEERNRLLREVGRCALRPDAGIGLPSSAIADLQARRTVTIRPQDVTEAHLEYWTSLRLRASFVDAEITALRNELGLGLDPDRLAEPLPALRADHQQQQERCFAMLDDHDTQQIPADINLEVLPAIAATSPARIFQRLRRRL